MRFHTTKSTILLSALTFTSIQVDALTLNGEPRSRDISVCFDKAAISEELSLLDMEARTAWVKEAIIDQSWGYYTQINFSGWGDCENTPESDIHITISDGAWSGGKNIGLPFSNIPKKFEKFAIQTPAIHEMGHQLGYTHETNRTDSKFYSISENSSQKFQLLPSQEAGWFLISRAQFMTEAFENRLCLDLMGEPQYGIVQRKCNDVPSQRFRLDDSLSIGGDWTNIVNQKTAECLDIHGGSSDNGAGIVHWQCYGGVSQNFRVEVFNNYRNVIGEDVVRIKNMNSQKYVDISGGTSSELEGTRSIQWQGYFESYDQNSTPYDPQSVLNPTKTLRNGYIFTDHDIAGARATYGSSGKPKLYHYLINKSSQHCFTLSWNWLFGWQSTQEICNSNSKAQKYRIVYLNDNEFRIYDTSTNLCIETNEHGNLSQNECSFESRDEFANNNQRFIMERISGNWVAIKSSALNLCLDSFGGRTEPGNQIGFWNCHYGDNQLFQIKTEL